MLQCNAAKYSYRATLYIAKYWGQKNMNIHLIPFNI